MLRRAMLAAQLPQAHNPMLLTRVIMLQLPLVMQRSPVMPLVLRVVLLLNILKTLSTQILIQLLNHNQRLLVVPLQLLLVQQAQHLLLQVPRMQLRRVAMYQRRKLPLVPLHHTQV